MNGRYTGAQARALDRAGATFAEAEAFLAMAPSVTRAEAVEAAIRRVPRRKMSQVPVSLLKRRERALREVVTGPANAPCRNGLTLLIGGAKETRVCSVPCDRNTCKQCGLRRMQEHFAPIETSAGPIFEVIETDTVNGWAAFRKRIERIGKARGRSVEYARLPRPDGYLHVFNDGGVGDEVRREDLVEAFVWAYEHIVECAPTMAGLDDEVVVEVVRRRHVSSSRGWAVEHKNAKDVEIIAPKRVCVVTVDMIDEDVAEEIEEITGHRPIPIVHRGSGETYGYRFGALDDLSFLRLRRALKAVPIADYYRAKYGRTRKADAA